MRMGGGCSSGEASSSFLHLGKRGSTEVERGPSRDILGIFKRKLALWSMGGGAFTAVHICIYYYYTLLYIYVYIHIRVCVFRTIDSRAPRRPGHYERQISRGFHDIAEAVIPTGVMKRRTKGRRMWWLRALHATPSLKATRRRITEYDVPRQGSIEIRFHIGELYVPLYVCRHSLLCLRIVRKLPFAMFIKKKNPVNCRTPEFFHWLLKPNIRWHQKNFILISPSVGPLLFTHALLQVHEN